MAFLETPRFPDSVTYGASFGPQYLTDVVIVESGNEKRNIAWDHPRITLSVTYIKSKAELKEVLDLFHAVKGRGHGFRARDHSDYEVTIADGLLGITGLGTGYPTYQLYKRYAAGSLSELRKITKPIAGMIIYRAGVAQTLTTNYTIDTTTGIVTFVATSTKNISAITKANPGVVTANAHGFTNGQLVYISGVGGMTQVNNVAFTVAGATTNTFQLSGVNTTSYSTYTSGGTAALYPQPSQALAWSGLFDIPVRFQNDQLKIVYQDQDILVTDLELIEIRI